MAHRGGPPAQGQVGVYLALIVAFWTTLAARPRGLGPRLRPFRNLPSRVLKGEPVGHATKDLGDRFTAASAQLNVILDPSHPGPRPPAAEVAALWVECNDARNYVLLGDPAARLRVDSLA